MSCHFKLDAKEMMSEKKIMGERLWCKHVVGGVTENKDSNPFMPHN